jgi:hypothetical protein
MSNLTFCCRSRWSRGLRRGSAAARLLGLRVRIPRGELGCLSVVCCQSEVSATSWSQVQRSPTQSLSVIVNLRQFGGPGPLGWGGGRCAMVNKISASLATVFNEPELQKLRHILHISQLSWYNWLHRQCSYNRKNEARSRNHFCCGKVISITYC